VTCPNRACRRTDPHDARGCVVAWEEARGTSDVPLGGQCRAVLPNDRSMRHDDGFLNCSLRAEHEGPHRTGYTGSGACEGHPAWTFDRAAIAALPSAYRFAQEFKP
jgi:hypothetical protein